MKYTFKNIALLLGLTLGFAVAAHAQSITSGAVLFNVTTPDAVDLRITSDATDDNVVTNGLTVVNAGASASNGLGVTINVADASPKLGNDTLKATVPVGLRSNNTYKVFAARSGTESTTNNPDLYSSDIVMYFTDPTNRNTGLVAAGTDSFTNGWNVAGSKTVGTLTTAPLQVLNGSRISLQGDNTTNNNFLKTDLKFEIKRQYYTAGSFSQTVTLSITAP